MTGQEIDFSITWIAGKTDGQDSFFAGIFAGWQSERRENVTRQDCLFVACCLLNHGDGRPFLRKTYYDKDLAPLPENQAAPDALTRPKDAANLLMECADAVATVGAEWETGIGAAFDWAMTQARRERGNGP